MRFDRDYELSVTANGRTFVVRPPIRIAFDADKSISGGLNKMNCQIDNLEERKRLALVKDREQTQINIPFSLKVGYKGSAENPGKLDLIFKGTLHLGSNRREGPDIVTTLESLDGGVDFLNSFTAQTVKGGEKAIEAILADMPNTQRGKITERPTLTRPKVLLGNSAKLIEELVGPGEAWYIDNEQLFILKEDEVVSSFIPLVNAATGLISTPERENKLVTFSTLINPSIKIGGRAKLTSTTAPHLDGTYRIETINYAGDNYGKDWMQTCTGRLASSYRVL